MEPRKQVFEPSAASMTPALPWMKTRSFGHDADLDAAAGQQLVEPAIAVAVQQRLDLRRRFVPALLQRGLADVLRHGDVGGVQFAVADDLHLRDGGDLLAHELEDRAAEVAGDALVGLRASFSLSLRKAWSRRWRRDEKRLMSLMSLRSQPSRWFFDQLAQHARVRASSGRSASSRFAR